ncbi:nuclear egress lamina protein [macacine betaherpesvirus 9]|uniref:Nuclear egress lamina protein n=1 Tax=macacine betaherpesvirus 9 TaxID=2560568 RepID=A0A192XP74_9BETA|nr:nuclear egress lamina protein [macacine betaherpesvirus 9]ANC96576.1 nuclear egress lamina protein [macacine betaherpesvirus 9]
MHTSFNKIKRSHTLIKTNKRYFKDKRKLYSSLSLKELHTVFKLFPDYELKFLNMMKLPITGKEPIEIPFDLSKHHQYTCLDLSPYANEQVSKSACINCDLVSIPTASDAMVAYMNQISNVMQNRLYYYAFQKNVELIRMSTKQPALFQIFFIVSNISNNFLPIIFEAGHKLSMYIVFLTRNLHIPCECVNQIMTVSSGYSVHLDILHDSIVLHVICKTIEPNNIQIDVAVLQRKLEEMDIPDEISDKFEKMKNILPFI